MYLEAAAPIRGAARARVAAFLHESDLDLDENVEYTAVLWEDGEIIATASLDGAMIKCVAVHPQRQGEDLCARLLSDLRREAFSRGHVNLMLYTKPEHEFTFRSLGFYPLARTADCLLMESEKNGLRDFLNGLDRPEENVQTGCIVAHANPFTLGHLYLVQRALESCQALHLFILSEDCGIFSPEKRLELARLACEGFKNVYIHPSGPYMVSAATFPDYFIRDKARIADVRCELDVRLFGEKIAPRLNIFRRFVGTEPNCPVTRAYNAALKSGLPKWGVELMEIPRLEISGDAVSASRVRALLAAGRMREIAPLVPKSTYEYLMEKN